MARKMKRNLGKQNIESKNIEIINEPAKTIIVHKPACPHCGSREGINRIMGSHLTIHGRVCYGFCISCSRRVNQIEK